MLVDYTKFLFEHYKDSDFEEKAINKLMECLPEDKQDPKFALWLLQIMREEQINFQNGVSVNLTLHVVCINDELVNLTPCEVRIIEVLTESPDYMCSNEELSQLVWHYKADLCNIRVNINNIRKKMGFNFIVNVKGQGYRLNVF